MMEQQRHQIREDLRKDPNELAHEADRARAELEHTLEALERRFSPGEIMDQVLDVVRHNGVEFGTNLATQVRNNPLPTLLAGAGLTWLITASSRPPHRAPGDGSARLAEHASSAARGAGHGGREVAHSAAGAARSAADSARSTAHGAADAVSGAAGALRSTGSGIAHASRSSAASVYESYQYMSREQPLILGALAVAAGAAIGAMLPSTETEGALMGEASEEAKERLGREGRRRADEAKAAAADMAEAAEQRIEREASEGKSAAEGRREESRREASERTEREESRREASERAEREESERKPSGRADSLRPGSQA